MTSAKTIGCNIRWMQRKDLEAVADLSWECLGTAGYTESDLRDCLRQKNCSCKVATFNGNLRGYIISILDGKRIRVISAAVSPKFQRRRVGSCLMQSVLKRLRPDGISDRVIVAARESNLIAQLFLKSLGFTAFTVDDKYYGDEPDDSVIMFKMSLKEEPIVFVCSDGTVTDRHGVELT